MTLLHDLPPLGLTAGGVVEGVHELLDAMGPLEPLPRDQYAGVVAEAARARDRLQALELRLVAAADNAGVAAETGAASTGAWHARATNSDPAESARASKLATALAGESLAGTSAALGAGEVSGAHAAVIAAAVERLPGGLSAAQVATVESDLVAKARRMDPRALRKAARRALAAVEADRAVVDAAQDQQLRDEETAALAKTRLTMRDNGDGTTTGWFTVPTLAGAILRKIIDQMASPRRGRLGASQAQVGDHDTANPAREDFDWPRRRGEALCSLLERLPVDHLHGKVAASLIVTTDLESLREGLRAAGLDTGEVISAAETRRLACTAGLIPTVLGGASQLLDLGRANRFFTEAQRLAGALRHHTCTADGCHTPYAWTELHHRQPWSTGGHTNLRDMVPLCSFHHHRIHDPTYHHHYRPDGTITFTRST
jgi:hypothetical protein